MSKSNVQDLYKMTSYCMGKVTQQEKNISQHQTFAFLYLKYL